VRRSRVSRLGANRSVLIVQTEGAQPTVVTRLLDVEGVSLRLRVGGPQNRTHREPAIIFEAGATASLETWDPIFSTVAGFATALAYDRAGSGQSSWDGLSPTPERVGQRLQRVLALARVSAGRVGIPPQGNLAFDTRGTQRLCRQIKRVV
jgi:hypothetical protein